VKVVFVMRQGVAHARPVETGISDEDRIEILDGIDEDDIVIVGPFRTLDEMVEGQPVELEKDGRSKKGGKLKDAPSEIEQPADQGADNKSTDSRQTSASGDATSEVVPQDPAEPARQGEKEQGP
jgi:hypothetical protein